jgi:hypothetical protein
VTHNTLLLVLSLSRDRRRTRQPIAIRRIIAGLEEYRLAPVAALGDVMGQAENDDAGHERG